MFKDKYVFAQLVQFLDRNKFNRLSAKYQGDRYVKSFTCWNQLLVMMFGQLSKSESLRDLIIALEVHWSKLYHLGMGKSVTRSNLAKANEGRDYRIFEEYAYHLVAAARSKSTEKMFGFTGHVYAFDSTTIDLCLEVFQWAKFRKHKGGIKVHTLYDIESQVPAFFHITVAATNDIKVMPEIPYEKGRITSSTVGQRLRQSLQDRADRSNVCNTCEEELEVQTNLMETEASKECFIRLYH